MSDAPFLKRCAGNGHEDSRVNTDHRPRRDKLPSMDPKSLHLLELPKVLARLETYAAFSASKELARALAPSADVELARRALSGTSEARRVLELRPDISVGGAHDVRAVSGRAARGAVLEPSELLDLKSTLISARNLSRLFEKLAPSSPVLAGIASGLDVPPGLIEAISRVIDEHGEVLDSASERLSEIRHSLRGAQDRLRTKLDRLVHDPKTGPMLQEPIVTQRDGRYVIPLRAEFKGRLKAVVHDQSASGATLFVEPLAVVDLNNQVRELELAERDEIRRILADLSTEVGAGAEAIRRTVEALAEFDLALAKARYAEELRAEEPELLGIAPVPGRPHPGTTLRLRQARHPLLDPQGAVPIDLVLDPETFALVLTGPNTGGKTVALKTAGLLAAMAQAGLHIPVETGSHLPVFQSIFADIGDEQSIAASLSTFSAHVAHIVAMDRTLMLPALVLLDEVGAGTDPVEGGALGIAVIDHFRSRGAHLIATTHYESLKSYASTTDGVIGAAFGFHPETFAPTYRLNYGSPGRSLAIEIAARLGLPPPVIAAARAHLTEPEKQLAEHLARVDEDLRRLEEERRAVARERAQLTASEKELRAREASVEAREDKVRRRLDAKLDDQLRDARRQIDAVIDELKARAADMSGRAAVRLRAPGTLRAAGLSTGEVGAARSEARAALEAIADRVTTGEAGVPDDARVGDEAPAVTGSRVIIGSLGLEGTVIDVHGTQAEVDVRGKRLRAALRDLRPIAAPPATSAVKVRVDLQPREGLLSELNVIGATVDEAVTRLEKFLDQSVVADIHELRIIHGHGTGQLRRGIATFLADHPLVERFETAPEKQGGGGATMVFLKD